METAKEVNQNMPKQKRKTINGKWHYRDIVGAPKGSISKPQAYKIAAAYRRKGYRARVVKEKTAKGERYFVYYREV